LGREPGPHAELGAGAPLTSAQKPGFCRRTRSPAERGPSPISIQWVSEAEPTVSELPGLPATPIQWVLLPKPTVSKLGHGPLLQNSWFRGPVPSHPLRAVLQKGAPAQGRYSGFQRQNLLYRNCFSTGNSDTVGFACETHYIEVRPRPFTTEFEVMRARAFLPQNNGPAPKLGICEREPQFCRRGPQPKVDTVGFGSKTHCIGVAGSPGNSDTWVLLPNPLYRSWATPSLQTCGSPCRTGPFGLVSGRPRPTVPWAGLLAQSRYSLLFVAAGDYS